MIHWYLPFALVVLLFVRGFDLSAPETRPKSEPSERKLEKVDSLDDQLPTYDDAELVQSIHYPDLARENAIEGSTLVLFVVNTTGRAEKVEIVQSDNPMFNEVSLEAIRNLHFTPATHNGKPVRVRMTIPINFTLSED